MSCELCKGGEDKNYVDVNNKAIEYANEKQVDVAIYLEEKTFAFMEAKKFFEHSPGRLIGCITPKLQPATIVSAD